MSLVEPAFRTELAAHYAAVRARLWAPRPRLELPLQQRLASPVHDGDRAPLVPLDIPVSEAAAIWRKINMRSFGGHVSPKSIIYITAVYFKVDVLELTGKNRTAHIVAARQCAMYLMRSLCHCTVLYHGMISFNVIAGHFGRHHSTAFHAIKRAKAQMATDLGFASAITSITDLLRPRNETAE